MDEWDQTLDESDCLMSSGILFRKRAQLRQVRGSRETTAVQYEWRQQSRTVVTDGDHRWPRQSGLSFSILFLPLLLLFFIPRRRRCVVVVVVRPAHLRYLSLL